LVDTIIEDLSENKRRGKENHIKLEGGEREGLAKRKAKTYTSGGKMSRRERNFSLQRVGLYSLGSRRRELFSKESRIVGHLLNNIRRLREEGKEFGSKKRRGTGDGAPRRSSTPIEETEKRDLAFGNLIKKALRKKIVLEKMENLRKKARITKSREEEELPWERRQPKGSKLSDCL